MLYPDEPGRAEPSDDVHHWAQLESKSDSMADELVQNLQLDSRCCQRADRFAVALGFAVLLAVFVGVATLALRSKDATDPPATSPTASTDITGLDPQ